VSKNVFIQLNSRTAYRLELFAILAVTGSIFFVVSAMVLPLLSGGPSLIEDSISSLIIGEYGYIEQAALYATGIGSFALALSIRQTTKGSRHSRLGFGLICIWAISIFLAGDPLSDIGRLFPEWSGFIRGLVHLTAAHLASLSIVAGILVLSKTFKRDNRWHSVSSWSLGLGLVALATLLTLFVVLWSKAIFGWPTWGGAIERVFFGTVILWLVLAALQLRSIAKEYRGSFSST
jgi:hypothetical protein